MPFPKRDSNTPEKVQLKSYVSQEAKTQLEAISRKMLMTQGEIIELLIRQTYTAQIELTNVKYLESREDIFKKICTDLHTMRGELEDMKKIKGIS